MRSPRHAGALREDRPWPSEKPGCFQHESSVHFGYSSRPIRDLTRGSPHIGAEAPSDMATNAMHHENVVHIHVNHGADLHTPKCGFPHCSRRPSERCAGRPERFDQDILWLAGSSRAHPRPAHDHAQLSIVNCQLLMANGEWRMANGEWRNTIPYDQVDRARPLIALPTGHRGAPPACAAQMPRALNRRPLQTAPRR